jgi:uncharacterized protein with HEPN domain
MSRAVSFAAGVGMAGLGYLLVQDAVWTRAERIGDAIRDIPADVPMQRTPIEVRG